MTRSGAIVAVLKTSFLDFQETLISQEPSNDFSRHLQISPIRDKATICMGVRRSGKSTFMLQHIRTLLNQGISPQNILHLNFFDDRLHDLVQYGLQLILEAYYSLYPNKKNTETIYCFA